MKAVLQPKGAAPASETAVPRHTRLHRRKPSGAYYLRAKVPVPLCGIVGKREIFVSLNTKEYDTALKRVKVESLKATASSRRQRTSYEDQFNEDQGDYFAVIFLVAFESSQRSQRDSNPRSPLEMLKYLLGENGMTAADLSRLLGMDRTLGAKILRGERNPTVPHLRIPAERFKVSPALFI